MRNATYNLWIPKIIYFVTLLLAMVYMILYANVSEAGGVI